MKKMLTTLAASALTLAVSQAAIVVLDENYGPEITKDINGYYDIIDDIQLTSNNQYILASYTFVSPGVTLEIAPGTIIRGEPGSGEGGFPGTVGEVGKEPGTLIVSRKGQILADGTPSNPIIFTTAVLDANNDLIPDAVDYTGAFVGYAGLAQDGSDFLDDTPKTAPLPPYQDLNVGDYDPTFADGTGNIGGLGVENQGYWGGIIVLGCAPVSIGDIDTANDRIVKDNKGNFPSVINPMEGQIEGLNTPLVGVRSVYGGRNPNDSSGTIRYVSIRHGGYAIANANEINGLTMGGVGFGTCLEFVEVYSNQDDGFEWFGGTVNSRYLVSLFNNDDSFDMDEGFTGLGQFWFSMQNDDEDNGNAAGEHDGTDADGRSVDQFAATSVAPAVNVLGTGDAGGGLVFTFPTVYNATYVGSGVYSKDDGDDGINNIFTLRDSWGGCYFNSIFSDFGGIAIALAADGDERWDLGDISFCSNVWYSDNAAYTNANWTTNVDLDGGSAHAGSNAARALQVFNNTGIFSDNVTTTDPFIAANRVTGAANAAYEGQIIRRNWAGDWAFGGFDPSALNPNLSVSLKPVTCTFFTGASYPGAFNPSRFVNPWTDNWTVFFDLFYQDRNL